MTRRTVAVDHASICLYPSIVMKSESETARDAAVRRDPDASCVAFGQFEMDLQTGVLARRGRPIRLEPLPTRVLIAMLRQPGELLLREDLLAAGWPGELHVSDQALNTCVRQIRTALRDSAHSGGFVETVPRRGYRFVYPVSATDAPQSPARPLPRRALLLTVASTAVAVLLMVWALREQPPVLNSGGPARLIVLPFDRLSEGIDEAVADGATEDLISELARGRPEHLQVIGRTTAEFYGRGGVAIAELARDLAVDFVVEGSLRVEGDGLRLVARLLRTDQEAEVWSHSAASTAVALPAVARDVARRIAASVAPAGDPRVPVRQVAALSDDTARTDYLMARQFAGKQGDEARAASVRYYDKVIARVPDFAPAHAGLSRALFWTDPQRASSAARRALQIDPGSALGHFVMSHVVLRDTRDLDEAEREARAAVELVPGEPVYASGLAFILTIRGQWAEARLWGERAAAADPVSAAVVGDLGFVYYLHGDFERAREHCGRALELGGGAWAAECLFQTERLTGNLAAAVAASRALDAAAAQQDAPAADSAEALEAFLRRRITRLEQARGTGAANAWELALAHADAGHRDDALRWLEAAEGEASIGLITMAAEPRMRGLRAQPRFRAIARRLGVAVVEGYVRSPNTGP